MKINNCLVSPWYPYFGNWPDYGNGKNLKPCIGDPSPNESNDCFPRMGHVLLYKKGLEGNPDDKKTLLSSGEIFANGRWEKQVWFPLNDGAKFVLEVAGFGHEHLSVEIKDDGLKFLQVVGSKDSIGFTESYDVPDAQSLDLENAKAEVKHGVLTIEFKKKIVAPKIIKIL